MFCFTLIHFCILLVTPLSFSSLYLTYFTYLILHCIEDLLVFTSLTLLQVFLRFTSLRFTLSYWLYETLLIVRASLLHLSSLYFTWSRFTTLSALTLMYLKESGPKVAQAWKAELGRDFYQEEVGTAYGLMLLSTYFCENTFNEWKKNKWWKTYS